MKPTYTLVDLIMVLRDQRFRRYQGINVLLNIFEDDTISPNRKKFMIIAGLRAIGLIEIGYPGDRKKIVNDVASEKTNNKTKGIKVPMQLFRCHLLNAIIQFESILN